MAWAMVAGAAIGVVGGAIASNQKNKAEQGAANTQAQTAKDANAVQLQMYNQSRSDNEYFRQNAMTAQNQYMQLMGLGGQPAANQPAPNVSGANPFAAGGTGMQTLGTITGAYRPGGSDATTFAGFGRHNPKFNEPDGLWGQGPQQQQSAGPTMPGQTPEQAQQSAFDRFRNTPGYQFGLDTGKLQLESSAAARGGLYSGAALKSLQKFGNDYADQQGYTPYMNRLASLAGMGQTANSQNQQAGMNYANQAGYNLRSAGDARASSLQQQGDNNSQLTAGIAGGISGLAQNYFAQRTPQTTSNYNWASTSGFGNNYGGW